VAPCCCKLTLLGPHAGAAPPQVNIYVLPRESPWVLPHNTPAIPTLPFLSMRFQILSFPYFRVVPWPAGKRIDSFIPLTPLKFFFVAGGAPGRFSFGHFSASEVVWFPKSPLIPCVETFIPFLVPCPRGACSIDFPFYFFYSDGQPPRKLFRGH